MAIIRGGHTCRIGTPAGLARRRVGCGRGAQVRPQPVDMAGMHNVVLASEILMAWFSVSAVAALGLGRMISVAEAQARAERRSR
jgi:hypothetical protein